MEHGRKTFSSTHVGKRFLGGKKTTRMGSYWHCRSEGVRMRRYQAQENYVVHRSQQALKGLPSSGDWFLLSFFSTQAPG